MPPIPKFPSLAKLISEAAPALAREGTESIAAKTATAEEKEFLDMLRQQMAEREAFKGEFNIPVGHGTSLEKTGGKTIEEFIPSLPDIPHGEGIHTAGLDKNIPYNENYRSNYFNNYAENEGGHVYPLKIRGNKVFNFDESQSSNIRDLIPSFGESFDKLSELTGKPVEELEQLSRREIETLIKQYPEHFESLAFNKQFKTFKPENIRGEFAEYDPLKRKSGDYMSGLAGAGLIGASALSSNDAEAAPSFKGLKGLIKGVAPSLGKEAEEAAAREAFKSDSEARAEPISASKESTPDVQIFRKKSNDQVMKEDLQKTKAELMQAYLDMNAAYANTPVDQRFAYPGAAENLRGYGAGGAEVSDISPIDFITPGMVVAPAKALGKGAVALAESEAAKDLGKSFLKVMADETGELTLTLPQMRALSKLKNPTKEEVQKIIEIPKIENAKSWEEARDKTVSLSDFAHRHRAGISEDMPSEYAMEEMQNQIYPHIKELQIPVVVNPDLSSHGRFTYEHAPFKPGMKNAGNIQVRDPKNLGVVAHELGHVEDFHTQPLIQSHEELFPFFEDSDIHKTIGMQKFGFLAKKIQAIRPELSFSEALEEVNKVLKGVTTQEEAGKKIIDLIGGEKNILPFGKGFHHLNYPEGYEMGKSLELLDPNVSLKTPSLKENARIIKEIWQQNPKTAQEVVETYRNKNFPNIEELIKQKESFYK